MAFFFFQRFSSVPRGQPGSIVGRKSPRRFLEGLFFRSLWTLPAVYVSAVIDGGSHPFPFRTRKLSLLSPMVLGLRARKSRSLQDSRPLDGKPSMGLFFMPASLRSALATTTRQYESPVAHGPPAKTAGGLFVFMRSRSRRCPAGTPSRRSLSPPRHVSTCRLRLTPLEENPRGALSFSCTRRACG